MPQNKYHPLFAHGEATVTGSLRIKTGFDKKVAAASAGLIAAAASEANKAPVVTVVAEANGDITIYCWKHTSATDPTLVAATSAVKVNWTAILG